MIMPFVKKFSGPPKEGGVSVSLQNYSREALVGVING